MRILLSFMQDNVVEPHPVPSYRFWTFYIKNGIEEAKMSWIEVPEVDWAAGLVPATNDIAMQTWRQFTWEKTIKYIKANRQNIDIFLCYLYPKQIDVQAIKQIREMGIPCVNFFCDNIRSFTKVPAEFNAFDLIWMPEFEAMEMYNKAGIDFITAPMPLWVELKYRQIPEQEISAISFIGSKDYLRAGLLAEVINKGLTIEIRGQDWISNDKTSGKKPVDFTAKLTNQANLVRNTGIKGFVAYHLKRYERSTPAEIAGQYIFNKPNFEEYVRLSRESTITLGINRVPLFNSISRKIITYSRLRDLEAPMLGACYLTEYTESIKHLYEIGIEVEIYTNADELVYKSKELINSQNKRKELRMKGQQKALNEHSIPVTLNNIKARLFN